MSEKNARRLRLLPTLLVGLLLFTTIASLGCQSMWDRHRENERIFSLDAARTHTQRGQCTRALGELDRPSRASTSAGIRSSPRWPGSAVTSSA